MTDSPVPPSGETTSFVAGLIAGLLIATPLAVWLSPQSGPATRQAIRQRGLVIRRQAGAIARKPLEQVQQQIEHIKGDSIQEALAEGKSIAALRAGLPTQE